MLKMVDGSGIIGVDMVCPLGVSTPQPPNYDSVELEGAGMLVLPNSLDAPLERLELGGKTEQVQTTGAQLFDKNSVVNGVIIADGSVTDNAPLYVTSDYIPVKPSVMYACTETGSKRLKFFDIDKQPVQKINFEDANVERGGTFTTGETTRFIRLSLLREKLDSIMLNEGSKSISYEPYTGGKPSPSPEYPQEIKSVGRLNEDTGKYEVDAKVTGKNLFDKDSVKKGYEFSSVASDMESPREGWFVSDFISVAEGKVYISGKSTGGGCKLYNKDKLFVKNIQATSGQLTIEEGISYFRLNGETKDLNNIQVELGSVSTTYEPYRKLQTLTITSDRPLTKWDRLVEQGGEIGWLYGSVIATIDETASISLYVPNGFYVYVKNIDKKEKTGYCDKLYAKRMSNGEPFVLFGNANNNVLYTLNTQEFYGKTASEIKAKLKEYPLNIIGKSETTEFIPLPQSEQNAIRALKTYYPATVITADGGELDPDIKVTYRKEI